MKRRRAMLPIVGILFGVSFLLFLLAQTSMFSNVTGLFQLATLPLQKTTYSLFHADAPASDAQKLQTEVNALRAQLAKQKELEKDIQALRDQFDTSNSPARNLLPASVVGMTTFLPGVSPAHEIVIDRGTSEGVKKGAVVVSRDNIVGNVVKTAAHASVVRLITHEDSSFTAKTVKNSVPGVIKGNGGERLVLDNVVLSDTLEKGDSVVTKGDVSIDGAGFPPDLVVGQIVSVTKKKSALFQTADVKSYVNFSRLEMVFVIVK